MKQRLAPVFALGFALLVASAPLAHAFPGLNLRWDACFGDGGALNRNFACDSNLGVNQLVGSFVTPVDEFGVVSVEAVVDFAYAGTSIPPWFEFFTAGSCRRTALGSNPTLSSAAVNCADWAGGAAVAAIGAYEPLVGLGPNVARLKFASAVLIPVDVTRGQEWFMFNLILNNTKTVGGECTGCGTPACIVFNSVNVAPGTVNAIRITGPTNGTDSHFVTWQGGAGVSTRLGDGCPRATPVRNGTWGEVKALYR